MQNKHTLSLMTCVAAVLLCGCAQRLPVIVDSSEDAPSVTADDTITLVLPDNTPNKLGISAPNGEWFMLRDDSWQIDTIAAAAFNAVGTLTLTIADIKGIKWIEGEPLLAPVFVAAGEYTWYFADNLETELDNTLFVIRKVRLHDKHF